MRRIMDLIQPKTGFPVFVNIVGSHLWESAGPNSDLDVFVCYQLRNRDVLLGRPGKSYQEIHEPTDVDCGVDVVFHEAGSVAHQLLKGNPNFLIGTLSNYLILDYMHALGKLREALWPNISRSCYNAFKGYGTGHYIRYIESGKDVSERRCNIAVRFFNFGASLLETGKPSFEPVKGMGPDDVYEAFAKLETAYTKSALPDKPEKPELLEDWLIDLRMELFNSRSG